MFIDQAYSFTQVLEIIGVLQCVFVITLMYLKATDLNQAAPSLFFFSALGVGFGLPGGGPYALWWAAGGIWLAQAIIPIFAYFLILQVATGHLASKKHLLVFLLPFIGPSAAYLMALAAGGNEDCINTLCPETVDFLGVVGVAPGAVVLLLLWLNRGIFTDLRAQTTSHERYWVVLAMIVFSLLNLGIDLPRALQMIEPLEADAARIIFGLAFIYLVTTLVFRIDPTPVVLLPGMTLRRSMELTDDEKGLAKKIGSLMELEKLYQEPTFSRTDLARELNVSENIVSKVINVAFTKSFRQLINEHRVKEAQYMLKDASLQITPIALDVGFNSLASFNRVFKEVTRQSPTEYRTSILAEGAEGE